MKSLTPLEKEILNKIKPRPEEYKLIHEVYARVKNVIEPFMRENGVEVEATLQGSVAHDTWLSGDRDIDVFVLFPKDTPIEKLRSEYFQLLVEASTKIGKYELRYAEHPYVRVYVGEVAVDIVPAYKLDSPSEIKTAVDRTPFHTKYLNSKLTDELRDHVRLLKQFMKTIGVYGAEVKIRGFSGYVVELLVIVYGGFREVLRATSKWRPPIYINSLELNNSDFKKLIKKLTRKYPNSVIYLPDPVDPERNAAANVSIESLAKFVVASQCYLRKPSLDFFIRKEHVIDYNELTNMISNRCIILLEVDINEELPPDVLWGELRRISDRATKTLQNHDFRVIDYSIWSDEKKKAYILFELEECVKNYPRLYRGPEFWKIERVLDYISKHVQRRSYGPWINIKGELLSLGKRKYVEASKVLVERSWEYMVAPHFRNIKPKVYVVDRDKLLDLMKQNGVREWIASFIVKRPFWMENCTQ